MSCKYECGRTAEKGTSRCRTCRRADRAAGVAMPAVRSVRPSAMRVLLIDIETAPNVVYTWGLWNQNIALNQIIEPGRMLCFAAKWLGERDTLYWSEHEHGHLAMVQAAWDLLDQADVVVHYYGSRFDVPHLHREFLEAGLLPPSPFKQVDLKVAVSKRFKLPSNKLDFVAQVLGLDGKVKHEGFGLWRSCLDGDDAAWKRMRRYNRRDVTLLEEVYFALLPWIPAHPNRHLWDGTGGCPACGSEALAPKGYARTSLSKFAQFVCRDCGTYVRSNKRLDGASLQGVVR